MTKMIKETEKYFLITYLEGIECCSWAGERPARGIYQASTPREALSYAFLTSGNRPIFKDFLEEHGNIKERDGEVYKVGNAFLITRLIPARLQDENFGMTYHIIFERGFEGITVLLDLKGIKKKRPDRLRELKSLQENLERKSMKKHEEECRRVRGDIGKNALPRPWYYEVSRKVFEHFINRLGAEIPLKYLNEVETFAQNPRSMYYGILPIEFIKEEPLF